MALPRGSSLNNPKTRYIRAFRGVLSIFLILNKFFFEIIGDVFGVNFKLGSYEVSDPVNVSLIILAIICLILDYLERNGKLKGSFLSVKKNKVGDINGNGNTINQTND